MTAARQASVLPPIAALMAGIVSVEFGAALARSLFPMVGAEGAVTLRVVLAAVILLALRRPSLKAIKGARLAVIVLYGAALGAMNLMFYLALRTVPLGIVVAVEFTGPLVLSALSHRGKLDLLWLALAAGGLVALAPFAGQALDPAGLLLALAAGVCWALYILFGQKAGAVDPGGATALGMTVAGLLVAPFGLAHAGAHLFSLVLPPLALAVAVLSSVIPYTLEMYALTRLPRGAIGALMSLEPAVAALAGWLMLGQHLSLRQSLAIGAIILASAGAAMTLVSRQREPAPPPAV